MRFAPDFALLETEDREHSGRIALRLSSKHKEKTMKIKLLILAMAVLGFASALPAVAQVIFSTTPIGVLGWGTQVSACRIASGATLASIDTSFIDFKSGKYGTIDVVCEVPAFPDLIGLGANNFGLTFNNQSGYVGGVNECEISTALVFNHWGNIKHPGNIGFFDTAGHVFSGATTANVGMTAIPDFTTNLYSINILMTRQTGVPCNPQMQAAFVQEVIP
jgi:hypothetical protein